MESGVLFPDSSGGFTSTGRCWADSIATGGGQSRQVRQVAVWPGYLPGSVKQTAAIWFFYGSHQMGFHSKKKKPKRELECFIATQSHLFVLLDWIITSSFVV